MAEPVIEAPLKPKQGEKLISRPIGFRKAVADEFCRRIGEGRSERSVCKDPDMPAHATIYKWEHENPEFATQYARARDERATHLAEEALTIGDGLGEAPTSEQIQAAKLRVDTRKWFASKLAPKKYGERVQTDSNVSVTGDLTMRLSAMSDDELARILADAAGSGPGSGVGVAPATSK